MRSRCRRGTADNGYTRELIVDESKRDTKLFVLDDRGSGDLANFVEGPIRQVDAAVMDRQLAVGVVNDGALLADRRRGLLAWPQNEHELRIAGSAPLTGENRLRSRAKLRSPSRSAVGGYPVSVKVEPIEET